MGFHDFAGSTAVHMVGGICALVGAKSSDLVLENMIKKGMPVRFPDTTFPLQLLAYLFSGSAGSVSTAALPQQLPQTSVISQ